MRASFVADHLNACCAIVNRLAPLPADQPASALAANRTKEQNHKPLPNIQPSAKGSKGKKDSLDSVLHVRR
ncbi:MAG: hypothetical protein IOC96_03560 [Rhodobacter sp.]|nr:hypothetical protein [Rhodobacter sp.]